MDLKIIYYDPYQDYAKLNASEIAKHFGYAYQKEVRVAFRPCQWISLNLEPVFLSNGSMTAYADLVHGQPARSMGYSFVVKSWAEWPPDPFQ